MDSNQFRTSVIRRRLFLQAAGVAATAWAARTAVASPAIGVVHQSNDPATTVNTRVHVIGLGVVGTHVALKLNQMKRPDIAFAGGACGASPDSCISFIEGLRRGLPKPDLIFIVTAFDDLSSISNAPRLAQAARVSGALTIALVAEAATDSRTSSPHLLEAADRLAAASDAMIVVPAARLGRNEGSKACRDPRLAMSIEMADLICGFSGSLNPSDSPSIDHEEVRMVLQGSDRLDVIVERASGADRAHAAVQKALNRLELPDHPMVGSAAALVMIGFGTGYPNLRDTKCVMNAVRQRTGDTPSIVFMPYVDPRLGHNIRVALIHSKSLNRCDVGYHSIRS